MAKRVEWLGTKPEKCDVCGNAIDKAFVDGKTKVGPWGILCTECWFQFGVGLGTGLGQLYLRDKDSDRFFQYHGAIRVRSNKEGYYVKGNI